MGEVYEVERADGQFARRVALSRSSMPAPTPRARFAHEHQIVGLLEHPGIARLIRRPAPITRCRWTMPRPGSGPAVLGGDRLCALGAMPYRLIAGRTPHALAGAARAAGTTAARLRDQAAAVRTRQVLPARDTARLSP